MNSDRIEGAAKDIGGRIEEAVGRVTGSEQSRAEGVARQIAGKGQNLYGQAKDGIRDAGDLADAAYDEGSRYVRQTARSAGDTVGTYPLVSLLLAGAVGFIAGAMFRRG